MRSPEYARLGENMKAFLAAFGDLRQHIEQEPTFMGGFGRWHFKQGHEQEAAAVSQKLSYLAGAAAEAFDESGLGIDIKPPGTFHYSQTVNPALVWSTIFEEMPMVQPRVIVVVGTQALGRLESLRAAQAERERGVVGAVAWFFTLAPRVRAAAGLPAHSAGGRVVAWGTAIAQGLLVGLLVALVAHILGWA